MVTRENSEPRGLRELAMAISRHWTDGSIVFVRNFSNVVYRLEGAASTPPLYLRLTPETHRSGNQISSATSRRKA